MKSRLEVTAAVISILVALPALFSEDFRSWLFPIPLIILLGGLVLLLAGINIRGGSRHVRHAEDQLRLDAVLSCLPRDNISHIEEEDFGIAWPESLLDRTRHFRYEMNNVEDQFNDRKLERFRLNLATTAETFVEAEAGAFSTKDASRYLGSTSSELDIASPAVQSDFEIRRRELHQAAGEFCDAHSELLVAARARGFDVGKVRGASRRSWAGQ